MSVHLVRQSGVSMPCRSSRRCHWSATAHVWRNQPRSHTTAPGESPAAALIRAVLTREIPTVRPFVECLREDSLNRQPMHSFPCTHSHALAQHSPVLQRAPTVSRRTPRTPICMHNRVTIEGTSDRSSRACYLLKGFMRTIAACWRCASSRLRAASLAP